MVFEAEDLAEVLVTDTSLSVDDAAALFNRILGTGRGVPAREVADDISEFLDKAVFDSAIPFATPRSFMLNLAYRMTRGGKVYGGAAVGYASIDDPELVAWSTFVAHVLSDKLKKLEYGIVDPELTSNWFVEKINDALSKIEGRLNVKAQDIVRLIEANGKLARNVFSDPFDATGEYAKLVDAVVSQIEDVVDEFIRENVGYLKEKIGENYKVRVEKEVLRDVEIDARDCGEGLTLPEFVGFFNALLTTRKGRREACDLDFKGRVKVVKYKIKSEHKEAFIATGEDFFNDGTIYVVIVDGYWRNPETREWEKLASTTVAGTNLIKTPPMAFYV